MSTLSKMTQDILKEQKRYVKKTDVNAKINFSDYPKIIEKICACYSLNTIEDLELKTEQQGLINRENCGDLELLQELHDELFQEMDKTDHYIYEKEMALSGLE